MSSICYENLIEFRVDHVHFWGRKYQMITYVILFIYLSNQEWMKRKTIDLFYYQ